MADGVGPGAIDAGATTYKALQDEDQRRDQEQRSLGRWAGSEAAAPPLPPGVVPHLPAGSPWASGDQLGPEPPLGRDINKGG